MNDMPVLNIGDIVIEAPAYVGQKVSGQQFKIIATYMNGNGFWHVAETTNESGVKVQVPLNDGGPYLHVVHRAAAKPTESPRKPSVHEGLLRDLEAMKGDWDKVLRPLAHWLGDEGKRRR